MLLDPDPDARWRVRPTDVPRLAEAQAALLRRAAEAVRPGGSLVYSTCTLLEDENEAVVAGFLAERPEFRAAAREALPAAVAPLVGEDGTLSATPFASSWT